MASKPPIGSPWWEFDSRTLDLDDDDTVATWPDQSGEENDATGINTPKYEEEGWNPGVPAVRLLGADVDRFDLDGSGFAGTDLTLFAVVQALNITDHLPIVGAVTSSTPPRRINWWIKLDGSVIFTFQFDPHDVQSAAGIVETGDKLVMTARYTSVLGKMIRVNGVEVGNDPTKTASLVSLDDASLGVIKDDITGGVGLKYGVDKRFAWISGYRVGATDKQILSMEAYLTEAFLPDTIWTPKREQIPPSTTWTP